jgi:UDP-N-acetylmuramate--alanine ligase
MQYIKRLKIISNKSSCLVSASFIQQNKDFADDFAKSLSQFDELLLLDIYPARELPMEGITSAWLLGKVNHKNKLISKRM